MDAKTIERRQKMDEALRLRVSGMTLDSIAKRLGYYDRSGVQKLLDDAIDEIVPVENIVARRALELERCDRRDVALNLALRAQEQQAANGNQAAALAIARLVTAGCRVSEVRGKLTGMFAPEKHEHELAATVTSDSVALRVVLHDGASWAAKVAADKAAKNPS